MKAPAIDKAAAIETAIQQTTDVIYLMGFSFVLGSLFTILILIVLDFMRRNKTR